ncbi:MAG: hypothetical protein GY797_14605 [Deltaproteobacteria bacterium]|nr:hypothetical protein [Deltaproteobacteria bacterium]
MNFMNISSLKRKQKTGLKLIGIFALIFVVLLPAASGFAEESKKGSTYGAGTIDRITGDKVIVNDSLFQMAPGVKFYTNSKMNSYANRSRFRKGTRVGYEINKNGEVTAMWLERK